MAPALAPSLRNSAAMAFDDARGQALLFGGYDAVTPGFGDTWRWDGSNWQQLAPANAPSPRWGHGLVFDRWRNRMVLFGGFSAVNGMRGDTWEWDGTDWIDRSGGAAPSPRSTAAMVFDRARGVTVLFGGSTQGGTLQQDTWTWNGSTWVPQAAGGGPSARRNAAVAWDDLRGELVLFGGLGVTGVLADTWTWGGGSWVLRAPTVSPPARQSAAMAYDPLRARTTLIGGANAGFATDFADAWEWDGGDWRIAAGGPPARHGAVMVHDPRRGELLMFGGRAAGFFGDTWHRPSLDQAATRRWVASASVGTFANGAAMAWDGARSQLIVHGGSVVSGPPPWSPGGSFSTFTRGETRRWNGTGWTVVANGPARGHHGIVYDSLRGRLVMYGGTSGGQPFSFVDEQDTWVWNGAAWTQVATTGPGPRSAHGMAYDVARDRVVVFGGVRISPYAMLNDTWEWNGTAWTQVVPPQAPTARQGLAMAYDPLLARTVLHGGAGPGPNELYGDTWEFDGVTWVPWPGGGAPPRNGHRMVFDSARGCLVTFGGSGLRGVPLDDTWQRSGRQWSPSRQLRSPAPRSGHAMAYDELRQRTVVAFGTTAFNNTPTDTWEETALPITGANRPASATAYGRGCGSTVPFLLGCAGSPPIAGGTLRALVVDAPFNVFGSAPAAMSLGFSSLTSPVGPLPYSLFPVAAADCLLLHSADFSVFLGATQIDTSGYLFSLAIPNQAAVLGVHVYGQAWFVDSNNADRITVSNAIDWQIGDY